jgi:hypothetical protein
LSGEGPWEKIKHMLRVAVTSSAVGRAVAERSTVQLLSPNLQTFNKSISMNRFLGSVKVYKFGLISHIGFPLMTKKRGRRDAGGGGGVFYTC